MNEQQANNTLDWIEALLSGKYPYGKKYLFNPQTGAFDALGVAMEINNLPIYGTMTVKEANNLLAWFEQHFGMKRAPDVYSSVNDLSNNFLAVAVLLLDAVPVMSAAIRRRKEALHAAIQSKVVRRDKSANR